MDVTAWLLDSDPAIRWQAMRDLTDASPEEVAAERARVATEGWGARLLALQDSEGFWGRDVLPGRDDAWGDGFPDAATRGLLRSLHRISLDDLGGFLDIDPVLLKAWEQGEIDTSDAGADRYRRALEWMWKGIGSLKPEWTSTTHTLVLLREMGLDPSTPQARRAVGLVRDNVKWDHDGQDYFAGEVEPCINGKTVALGAYFGEDVDGIVDRLLGEQMAEGGWNCEAERGSVRASFNTTIEVLEGLLEYERSQGPSPAVTEARVKSQEYLLERGMLRRRTTGELVDPDFARFAFPTGWHYDVLRGLDYLRKAGVEPDPRCAEAIALVEAKRTADGRWSLEVPHQGRLHFPMDEGEGKPSLWNTLRALRVLRWYEI